MQLISSIPSSYELIEDLLSPDLLSSRKVFGWPGTTSCDIYRMKSSGKPLPRFRNFLTLSPGSGFVGFSDKIPWISLTSFFVNLVYS